MPVTSEKVGRGGVRPVAARWWVKDQLSLLVSTLGLLNPWNAREREAQGVPGVGRRGTTREGLGSKEIPSWRSCWKPLGGLPGSGG